MCLLHPQLKGDNLHLAVAKKPILAMCSLQKVDSMNSVLCMNGTQHPSLDMGVARSDLNYSSAPASHLENKMKILQVSGVQTLESRKHIKVNQRHRKRRNQLLWQKAAHRRRVQSLHGGKHLFFLWAVAPYLEYEPAWYCRYLKFLSFSRSHRFIVN